MPFERWLHVVSRRFDSIFRSNRVEADLSDELQFHLEERAREFVARGMSERDARNAALRAFGGVEQRKEECRDQRRVGWLEDLGRDLSYAGRMMRRSPGFTAVALISLALGLGANTAIFTAIDAVMLRPLPVPRPEELLSLRWTAPTYPKEFVQSLSGGRYPNDRGTDVFSYRTFRALNDSDDHGFAALFAFTGSTDYVNLGLTSGADMAIALGVSGNYFDALGIAPMLGRALLPSDDAEGAAPVAVASYAFWQTKLGASRDAIGRAILMNGEPMTIVGIAPAFFFGLEPGAPIDLWIPLRVYARGPTDRNVSRVGIASAARPASMIDDDKTWWLRIGARSKPAMPTEAALAAATVIFERSIGRADHPAAKAVPHLEATSLTHGIDTLQRSFSGSLFLLMAIVGLVLVIACANLAGLLLERSRAREREIAVRLSLGVSRARLVRQLLTESVALALLGGIAALAVAGWTYPLLMSLLVSGRLAPDLAFAIDLRVLGFALLVSLAAGLMFGLAPALRASAVDFTGALKQRSSSGGHGGRLATGRMLVAVQVAITLVLLVGAGLFVRTLQRLHAAELGFDRNHLLLFTVSPAANGYADARLSAYYSSVHQRIAALPGVVSATLARRPALGGGTGRSTGRIIGFTPEDASVEFYRHEIGSAYFTTLGIPLVAGRAIDDRDTAGAARVLVVNETLVKKYFGATNPIGHRIDFGSPAQPMVYEIVGVARDVKYSRIQPDTPPTVYLPHEQAFGPSNSMTFMVRTPGEPSEIVPAIRRELESVDSGVPMTGVRSQAEAIDQTLSAERTFAVLSSCFGVLALLVACVGLYGTMAYAVTRRTNEIGIRIALGASRHAVVAMILRESLQTVGAGAALGLLAALAAGRVIATRLYGVTASDGATLAAATALLTAVAVAAAMVPARRATRIDPTIALRCD